MIPALPWEVPSRLHGVDVSSVQARLPMSALIGAGVAFVIAKATDGEWDDHAFATHVVDAAAAGLATGSYHFFRSSDPARAQMDVYARAIDGRNLTMRPVLDWEDTARIGAVGPSRALANMIDALGFIQAATGRRPIIYTGIGVMRLFDAEPKPNLARLADLADLWVAHYRWNPADGADLGLIAPTIPRPWTETDLKLWQFCGNRGPHIAGVPFDIDRDIFFGDAAAFSMWCGEARTPTLPSPPLAVPDGASATGLQIERQKEIAFEASNGSDDDDEKER